MRFPGARILIFAKAPRPGRVKTRLIPPLTPQAAADLHRRLLTDTAARLAGADLAPTELWCAPDTEDGLFRALACDHGLSLRAQQGADLGERMGNAAADALRRGSSLIIVGTDCPPLDGAYISSALAALADSDAVLGPAEDGGYVLLGLRRMAPELFTNMPWGTERVAAMTRERLRSLGWSWAELSVLWDLDRPEDLNRYRAWLNAAG